VSYQAGCVNGLIRLLPRKPEYISYTLSLDGLCPTIGGCPTIGQPARQLSSKSKGSANNDGGGNQNDEPPPRGWWHWQGLPALGVASAITSLCGASALYFPIIPIPILYAVVFCYAIFLLVRGTVSLWGNPTNAPQNNPNEKDNDRPKNSGFPKLFPSNKSYRLKKESNDKANTPYHLNYFRNLIKTLFHTTPPRGK